MYGKGISREGSLVDVGVEQGFVKKSGAWYTYEGEQLGQGRENAKQFLTDNPEVMVEIDGRIRSQLGLGETIEGDDNADIEAEDELTPSTTSSRGHVIWFYLTRLQWEISAKRIIVALQASWFDALRYKFKANQISLRIAAMADEKENPRMFSTLTTRKMAETVLPKSSMIE